MVAIEPEQLIKSLKAQGFRVEQKSTQSHHGWTVMAPEGVETPLNPSGTVHIHERSLYKEKHTYTSILNELKKIGFDPELTIDGKVTAPAVSLEEQTGMEVYRTEPDPEGDPDDIWVRYEVAGEAIGISASGISQRVKAGKLRAVKIPIDLPAFQGAKRRSLVWHVNLAEVKGSGEKSSRGGRHPTLGTARVTTRYEDSSVGRLREASMRLAAATRKIESGFEDLRQAAGVIERESTTTLEELAKARKKLKDVEAWMERGVSKL
jgi:hypothetical protein